MRKPHKILLIDDNVQILSVFKKFFADLGYECLTANRSSDGIVLFDETTDVVICDCHMPDLNGIFTLQRIYFKSEQLNRKRPFTFLVSGFYIDPKDDRLKDVPVDHILLKPFTAKQIHQILESVDLDA
jgi:CheY-like chemotaxis protein